MPLLPDHTLKSKIDHSLPGLRTRQKLSRVAHWIPQAEDTYFKCLDNLKSAVNLFLKFEIKACIIIIIIIIIN